MARLIAWLLAAFCWAPTAAAAQQQEQPQPAQPQEQTDAWAQLPRMQLERQFAGPLQDTIVQRWRDPVDGVICYIYLPISAQHSAPGASGFVQYGANTIGSISCLAPPASTPAAGRKKIAPRANSANP